MTDKEVFDHVDDITASSVGDKLVAIREFEASIHFPVHQIITIPEGKMLRVSYNDEFSTGCEFVWDGQILSFVMLRSMMHCVEREPEPVTLAY